jgi:hypothetical protein
MHSLFPIGESKLLMQLYYIIYLFINHLNNLTKYVFTQILKQVNYYCLLDRNSWMFILLFIL